MRLTAKEARRRAERLTSGDDIDVICSQIINFANDGKRSWACSYKIPDKVVEWLELNGFDVYVQADYSTAKTLISWEYAEL